MKVGSLIAEKYRLTRPIAEGAMGAVWEATHEGTSRQVAVKLIVRRTDELRHRMIREARACGALRHRNIVDIYDVGTTAEGDPFLVMQLLVGETLADHLARKRRLEVPEAARIGRDVARALAATHAASIIHRDLKPANIFLHEEPGEELSVIKVLDFGVSKNQAVSDGMMTVAGGVVGSPAYMSPEQAGAGAAVDHRTDLWSLGVVLFEMLAGRRPPELDPGVPSSAESPHVSRFVRNVDAGLDALVARCLERDRSKRIGTASELATALQRYTASGTSSSGMAAVAVPRAPLASVSEIVEVAPVRLQSGSTPGAPLMAAGPAMPGGEDDEVDQATARLDPRMLRPAVAVASRAEAPDPPTAQLAPRGGPVPAPAFGSGTYPAPTFGNGPASAPAFGSGTHPAPTFGGGVPPSTARLQPGGAWAGSAPAAPTAVAVQAGSGAAPMTGQGTVKMTADYKKTMPLAPTFGGAPPPPSGGLSAVSSTAPVLGPASGSGSASAGRTREGEKRRRTALLAAGGVVGVALAILVVAVIRVVLGGHGKGTEAASTAASAAVSAAVPVPATAVASAAETAAPAEVAPAATASAKPAGKAVGTASKASSFDKSEEIFGKNTKPAPGPKVPPKKYNPGNP